MERIGQIVNTHGIKGELKIKTASDFLSERFGVGNSLFIEIDNKYQEFEISSFRVHKSFVLVSFKDLLDINLVEKYKGYIVYQELEELELEEDEYMYSDLIGLEVYNQNNVKLAKVINVEQYPAQDILVVLTNENKEKRIPFVSAIVLEVSDKIVIEELEGLL